MAAQADRADRADRAYGWTIGQVAERLGVSADTLRYYEREGLVPTDVRRTAGGRRAYSDDDIEWFEICRSLRASGMPVETIRRYAELVRAGTGNEAERLDLLERHRCAVDEQIARLRSSRELIDYKVRTYRAHLEAGSADRLWTGRAEDAGTEYLDVNGPDSPSGKGIPRPSGDRPEPRGR